MEANEHRDSGAPFPDLDEIGGDEHRGRRRRTILFAAAFIVLVLFVVRPWSAPAGWDGDFEAAMIRAQETNRPVVVAFHGRSCPPCHVMDRTVLGKPAVTAALKGFVPVRIDPNANLDVARAYEIYATPTYVVLQPDGKLVHGIVGPQSVEEFVAFLELSLGLSANHPLSGA